MIDNTGEGLQQGNDDVEDVDSKEDVESPESTHVDVENMTGEEAIEHIKARKLNFTDDEMEFAGKGSLLKKDGSGEYYNVDCVEVSEDVLTRAIVSLSDKKGELNARSFMGPLLRIIARDSMQNHPDREVFKIALAELEK